MDTRVAVAFMGCVGSAETVDEPGLSSEDWVASGEPTDRIGIDASDESRLGGTVKHPGAAAHGSAPNQACSTRQASPTLVPAPLAQPAAATASRPSPAAMTRRRDG